MNKDLENFLSQLTQEQLIHLVCDGATIIGKFSKVENETVVLSFASVFGERFPMGMTVDINKIVAWGYGGKSS